MNSEVKRGEETMERRLEEALAMATYYRRVAEENGVLRLRETEMLSRMVAQQKGTESELRSAYKALRETQDQLVQSAKMAALGEVAAGIVHELNQPLMVIRSTAQVLLRNIHKIPLDEVANHIKYMERNTGRMMKIVDHLRSFSRKSEAVFAATAVGPLIDDALSMVMEDLRQKEITVEVDIEEGLPTVHTDGNKLEQVIVNLITNARDAIAFAALVAGARSAVCLKTAGEGCEAPFRGRVEIVARCAGDGDCAVELLFRDNGNGISNDNVGRIFDPFFTTKTAGQGTGLGLSISYKIIRELGGTLSVAETSHAGTTFRIMLPLHAGEGA